MKIRYHKFFEKRFKKLSKGLQEKTLRAIQRFAENPFDSVLKNHALRGKMKGKRAFSVTGDIRIVFEEYNQYVLVIMLDVGSHAQIYGE